VLHAVEGRCGRHSAQLRHHRHGHGSGHDFLRFLHGPLPEHVPGGSSPRDRLPQRPGRHGRRGHSFGFVAHGAYALRADLHPYRRRVHGCYRRYSDAHFLRGLGGKIRPWVWGPLMRSAAPKPRVAPRRVRAAEGNTAACAAEERCRATSSC